MPRNDIILFLDTETTGVEEEDELIEIGVVMLRADTLEEIDYFQSIIVPSKEGFDRINAKSVVREMHMKNGLYSAIIVSANKSDLTSADIDNEIMSWLHAHVGIDITHIPYGGSGVVHFDRRFITKYLPKFDKMLTHWAYDVGTIRRSFVRMGLQTADTVLRQRSQEKDHRALQDAKVHADEFRYYSHYFKTGEFPDEP